MTASAEILQSALYHLSVREDGKDSRSPCDKIIESFIPMPGALRKRVYLVLFISNNPINSNATDLIA